VNFSRRIAVLEDITHSLPFLRIKLNSGATFRERFYVLTPSPKKFQEQHEIMCIFSLIKFIWKRKI
jgi:hypothetical protein